MVAHETLTDFIPDVGLGGVIGVIAALIIGAIIILLVSFVIFLYLQSRKFDKRIIVFEKIGGRYENTGRDRGAIIKFGKTGDTILYLLRRKKYLPTPSIQSGRKIYWYVIREDGEWINFSLGDIDMQMKKAGAKYLDNEMRYARTQIQKGLKERYEQSGFWKQYGTLIASVAFIVVLGVMVFLLFDKWIELAGVTNQGVATAGEVLEETKKVLSALDNICSGGSGFR